MKMARTVLVAATLVLVFHPSLLRARDPAGERGKARWRAAFVTAIRDPGTWAPAAGALLFVSGDYDEAVSDWAVRTTPLFGSPPKAREASDALRTATHVGMLATSLVTLPRDRWSASANRLFLQHVAVTAATSTAALIKDASGRMRPDGSNAASFPSSHSARAFAYAAIGSRNLDSSELPGSLRSGFRVGLTTLAAGTAWARVEGGRHYPSDVLAGAALGNFVGILINDGLLRTRADLTVDVNLNPREPEFRLRWRF